MSSARSNGRAAAAEGGRRRAASTGKSAVRAAGVTPVRRGTSRTDAIDVDDLPSSASDGSEADVSSDEGGDIVEVRRASRARGAEGTRSDADFLVEAVHRASNRSTPGATSRGSRGGRSRSTDMQTRPGSQSRESVMNASEVSYRA